MAWRTHPGQDAVLLLLFGLLRSGQVRLRALVGISGYAGDGGGVINRLGDDALRLFH